MPWPPSTEEEAYDITWAEAETVRQQLAGKPVSVFHRELATAVGTIDRGYWDARGNLCVEFTLNGSTTAQAMGHDILNGLKRGLSLQHNWRTLEVKEVSLTDIGARDGTWIEQMQLPGDKHEFVALPSRPRPLGMSEIPRDPVTGQFMSASAASGAPAANSGVAPMDTGPAPPARDQAAAASAPPAAAAAAGSEGPVDPLLAIISNETIPVEQRKQLIENFKAQRTQAAQAMQQLQEAQVRLAESKKQEQNMMGVYVDTVSRLVAMGGQDLRAAGPRAEEAMAKNDFAGFAAATADVMVKASGTIEKLLESRKRAMEQSVTTNQLMEEYQRFNAELRLPPSSTPAAAAAAAVQQQQQQQFAPAMVAASGSYSGRAPAQQQHHAPAPPQPQQSQYRDGRSLLPPELHAAWAGYMATQDTTVDVAGVMERAQNVMARGM